jgi:outer membrane protein assembly factor BamB
MTSRYLLMAQNSQRRIEVPCHLSVPLKETWHVAHDGAAVPPLIEGGLLFVRQKDNTLAALTEEDRSVVWEYPFRGALMLSSNGQLYFAGEDHRLHVIESRAGTMQRLVPFEVIGHSAIIAGFLVCTTGATGLIALDPASGKEVWGYRVPKDHMLSSTFCGTDDRVIIGQDERVLALSARTGDLLWEHVVADLPLRMPGEPDRPGSAGGMNRIHGNTVIVTVPKDHVVGLSVDTGERLWTWTSDFARAAAAGAGYLYGSRYYLTGANGSYHIIDADSGSTLFETSLKRRLPKKQQTAWGWSPLLVSETNIFVGSRDGHILAFARESGEYEWSTLPSSPASITDLTCVNRRLYCCDMGGRLRCFAPKRRWRKDAL